MKSVTDSVADALRDYTSLEVGSATTRAARYDGSSPAPSVAWPSRLQWRLPSLEMTASAKSRGKSRRNELVANDKERTLVAIDESIRRRSAADGKLLGMCGFEVRSDWVLALHLVSLVSLSRWNVRECDGS